MSELRITLPAGNQITLLPGRTEAITIAAVESTTDPAPITVHFLEFEKGSVLIAIGGTSSDQGNKQWMRKGDDLVITPHPAKILGA